MKTYNKRIKHATYLLVYIFFHCPITLTVRMSVQMRNSKTIVPSDLIILHKKYYARGSVLL